MFIDWLVLFEGVTHWFLLLCWLGIDGLRLFHFHDRWVHGEVLFARDADHWSMTVRARDAHTIWYGMVCDLEGRIACLYEQSDKTCLLPGFARFAHIYPHSVFLISVMLFQAFRLSHYIYHTTMHLFLRRYTPLPTGCATS